MSQALYELQNVSKVFRLGGRPFFALRDVSLSIRAGETLGILGESGCGKSTLAKVMLGVYPPSGGQLLFCGQPLSLRGRRRRAFASSVQMIFQDPYASLDPHMTVRDILSENLELHTSLDRRQRGERVAQLLEQVGLLPEYASRHPHAFSGGQRQRISIARALAAEPSLLVCDEPVSALDHAVEGQIMELLASLRRELGLTCLFITHDVALLRSFCDRISVLYAGRVVEQGPAQEVCRQPQHPYTQMLLRSVLPPRPVPGTLDGADTVRGEAAPTAAAETGCPFAGRCPHGTDRCRQETPVLTDRPGARQVACLAEESFLW